MARLMKIKTGTAVLILVAVWVICLSGAIKHNSDAGLVWSFIPMVVAFRIMLLGGPEKRLFAQWGGE